MDSYEAARKSLAFNIRTRRKALGLSQEALALEADVNRTFVSQIERAIGNPSLHPLCRLSDRLGIDCHALLLAIGESPALS
jgi:transcriptional regulator with XRE-family HTH domain